MLYVFAGYPKCGLNAGGLRRFIEVEAIGLLEEDPCVQYTSEGILSGEDIFPIDYRMSDLCKRDGIGWRWFPENTAFGNSVTIHKTTAEYHEDIVFHVARGELKWEKLVEDRAAYEARWALDTCPQESHVVHLTWCIFKHKLPEFMYERLRVAIEGPSYELSARGGYESKVEPGKYKSETHPLTFGRGKKHAIPSL